MSIRAVAIRGVPAARVRVVRRVVPERRSTLRTSVWARLADDRDLIGVKMLLLLGVMLVVMALEVF